MSRQERPEFTIRKVCRKKGITIATAESCTGGMIATRITDVPGSSRYFLGGFVVYSNESKKRFLNVTPETLDRCGAVSSQTAFEMARGVKEVVGSTVGLSVTGIAGPGGSREKPLGTVYVGVSDSIETRVYEFRFSGATRRSMREKTTHAALLLLVQALKGNEQKGGAHG